MHKNKRAQVAETMTWVVATVIIIIILLISVFVASLIPKTAYTFTGNADLFAEQSLVSYLITPDSSGGSVYSEIKNSGSLNDYNGNLAAEIFKTLYSGYYSRGVYLGIYDSSGFVNVETNKYFGAPPSDVARSDLTGSVAMRQGVNDFIYLDGTKYIHMVLSGGYS
ncbi:MAG: hypothetical protein KGH55_00095 [Nanoarchaeota archaeon]|nr:hypothetical protein [Nanoarchaeota archaeon]